MRKRNDGKAIWQILPRPDERGIVMVVTLLAMVILVIIGSVLIVTSLTEDQIASNDVATVQALYVAEGGIQKVLNDLNKGLTPSALGTIGPGVFTASVTDAPPPVGQKRIEVCGYVPNQASARGVRRVSVLVYRPSPFQWSAFGDTYMNLSGGGITDSYDSDIGSYGGSNVGSNGDVGSNGNVDLSGFGTQVRGDAAAGTTVADSWRVTGTATNGAPLVNLPAMDCPSGGYTPWVPSGAGITYNSGTGDLSVTGGNNLTLSAPGTYYFHDLSLWYYSTLTISAGGHVDIFIAGQLDCTYGRIVNNSALPTNLSIWGCGTSTDGWSLSGGSGAYLALYAPHHQVTISGSGELYGSVIGRSVTSSSGSRFHFDEALARQPGIGKYAIAPRSWTELSP
jgi:hypothetical protein